MAQKSKGTAKAKASAKPAATKGKGVKPAEVKATAKGKGAAKPVAVKVAAAKPPKAPASSKGGAQPVAPAKEIAKAKAALKATQPVPQAAPPAEAPAKAPRARKISVTASANEAASALSQKWSSLFKKSEQIEAKPYNMKASFEEKTAIVHKVLGWGYILANRNDRLEVLFKDGIKYLISNYKP